jgi:plasmid stabilization system protein ParE
LKRQLPIRLARRAERQISEVFEWWQQNRPDAPDAVREEIARAIGLISSQPRVGGRAVRTKLPNIRRFHLVRIRYDLYYRITSSAIEVLAFWHSSRGSGPPL